jgi:myo-inositol-1(or 4)-monophosphatase
MREITDICLSALNEVKSTLDRLGNDKRDLVPALKDEPVTKSDLVISKRLKDFFLKSKLPAVYISEEAGEINPEVKNPLYHIYWDELDGTFNFQRGGLLPFTAVISAFEIPKNGRKLIFDDAIFGAVMDLRTRDLWYAEKGGRCFFNGREVTSSDKTELDKKTFLMIDHGPCPSKEEVIRYLDLYSSAWVHNVSSAGFHIAGVASGDFDGFVCSIQKAHELGAGYLLVKESMGGATLDFEGKPIGYKEFDFNAKYSLIAAGTYQLAQKIREKIKD